LVPRSSSTPVAAWAWPTWVVSQRRLLEAVFVLLESSSPSRRIFIGSHSLPPLWFAVSILQMCTLFDLSIALRLRHNLLRSLCLHLARGFVRHGYPWVHTDQAHDRHRQVGPPYQKTSRPVSRPAQPDMWAQRCEDNLTCKTRQSIWIKATQISFPYCN
jgi:hypothetical protein